MTQDAKTLDYVSLQHSLHDVTSARLKAARPVELSIRCIQHATLNRDAWPAIEMVLPMTLLSISCT
jgi:hypothetical protein